MILGGTAQFEPEFISNSSPCLQLLMFFAINYDYAEDLSVIRSKPVVNVKLIKYTAHRHSYDGVRVQNFAHFCSFTL